MMKMVIVCFMLISSCFSVYADRLDDWRKAFAVRFDSGVKGITLEMIMDLQDKTVTLVLENKTKKTIIVEDLYSPMSTIVVMSPDGNISGYYASARLTPEAAESIHANRPKVAPGKQKVFRKYSFEEFFKYITMGTAKLYGKYKCIWVAKAEIEGEGGKLITVYSNLLIINRPRLKSKIRPLRRSQTEKQQ